MTSNFGCDPIPGIAQLQPDSTYLVVLNGSAANQAFPLNRLRSLIGRSHPPDFYVDIDLSGCELNRQNRISRQHAVIQWVNNKLQIIDLGSRNGTFVDGEQLISASVNQPSAPRILTANSQLRLADLEFAIANSR
ncbi:MAG: FHA domain-containing protein [Cyanobacteria bacterium J06592_8]